MTYANIASIFEYDDYLKLIADLISIRKSQGLPFSFRWFSQKAGFTSPNYLHLILAKKRHLSDDAAEKVAQVFRLGRKETEYFLMLVQFNKAKTPSARAQIGEQMMRLRAKSKIEYLQTHQMNYYLSWQNIAVRECLLLNRDGLTIEELGPLIYPQPSARDLAHTLATLSALQLVEQNSEGLWKALGTNISSGDRVASSSLIKYHLQMMDLAKESLDRFSGEDRDISNVSVPLSKSNFEKVRRMIQDVRAEALRLSAEDTHPDIVAQVNFQLFPLATKKGNRK